MSVTRRHFLGSTAAVAGALATSAADTLPVAAAQPRDSTPAATIAAPTWPIIALQRMGYGPRPGDAAVVQALGLAAYVDQQLNPAAIDDSACDGRINAAQLRIKYAGVDELRPLSTLTKSVPELWPLTNFNTPMDYQERIRPFNEVRVATWLRAVYSKRQLQEVLVDFWHNHFNVNATGDIAIGATFPVYDRLIRSQCLGNFRTFLEEVAKSAAMMYALDNASNRAGGGEGGNENYARELFELHTLGSDNYLKFYDAREQIGTVTYNGIQYARGYIDEDVYEAARCLTGWTIKNGHWERPSLNDGTFLYDPNWHDTNPKSVLGTPAKLYNNIPRNQADMKDAQDVFTLLAGHPGTARHICTKLCRRLISDTPPAAVVDAAVAEWMAGINAPDQLKRVVRKILLSTEFQTTWGQKVKRPFEAAVAYLRATNAELPSDDMTSERWNARFYQLLLTGHRLFEWPTPTGYPDVASYWINTNGLLRVWNLPFALPQSWGGGVQLDLLSQTPGGASCTQIVDFWIDRLCGFSIDPAARQELISFIAQGGNAAQPPRPTPQAPDWGGTGGNSGWLADRINSLVQLIAMCPDFHTK